MLLMAIITFFRLVSSPFLNTNNLPPIERAGHETSGNWYFLSFSGVITLVSGLLAKQPSSALFIASNVIFRKNVMRARPWANSCNNSWETEDWFSNVSYPSTLLQNPDLVRIWIDWRSDVVPKSCFHPQCTRVSTTLTTNRSILTHCCISLREVQFYSMQAFFWPLILKVGQRVQKMCAK